MKTGDTIVSFFTPDALCIASRVRIAATFNARRMGLLNRHILDDDEGLLLRPGGSIHTVGMRFAIDVVFLDRRLRILKIAPYLQPYRLALAPRGTQSVLEIRAGRAGSCGLIPGMRLSSRAKTGTHPSLYELKHD